ncbi:hypothetical protein CBS101457_003208 [Exobasidium rhododendri]|nr:hypothetical protein CBS101457_003208 [Exobasidium rhododendri]
MLRTFALRSEVRNASRGRLLGSSFESSSARVGFAITTPTQATTSTRSSAGTLTAKNIRPFSSSIRKSVSNKSSSPTPSILASYNAPLSKTFFRLKTFSLGSLTLASALCPALLFAPGSISTAGRIGLCVTALVTSGGSTGLIAWIGKPYVTEMQLLTGASSKQQIVSDLPEGDSDLRNAALARDEVPAIQVITRSWRLQKLRTTIYEPSLIRPTKRPFATWELPTTPPSLSMRNEEKSVQSITKLIAATRDAKTDKVVGRWWARWTRDTLSKDGNDWKSDGQCSEEGKVIRHFSIHEELLDEDWQVL